MPSSDTSGLSPAGMVERMTGAPPVTIERVLGGGNNQLYRVVTGTDETHALKIYRKDEAVRRPRLQQEFAALSFLGKLGYAPVPAAIAADEGLNAALYEWVEGERPETIGLDDIEAVLSFVALLKTAGSAPEARRLPDATEACLSLNELVSQIRHRRARFDSLMDTEFSLAGFLRDQVDEVLDRAIGHAGETQSGGPALGPEARCLSPSDFGFHNAIRKADGSLIFLDMEYFGWDDPVKLAADFVLHPGMRLSLAQTQHFVAGWQAFFEEDAEAGKRYRAHLPLYALRWTMILLNEFLPERWKSRVFSGQADAWEAAKTRQMRRAEAMLERARVALDGDIHAGASDAGGC